VLRMKHALVVAYHFPPESSSSGVLRTLKYVRYLGGFGWRTTVVTLNRDAYEVTDPRLEEQIPRDVHVIRTPFVDVKRHLAIKGKYLSVLAIPDRLIGWWPWAVAAGSRVLKEDPMDLIYSTSPYATAHLVALTLSRRSGIPWVADVRDPLYDEPPEAGTTRLGHFAARRLERLVVRRAHRIVTTTARLRDTLAGRYSMEPQEKFVAIPNGYDEEDFSRKAGPSPPADELLIVHAGVISESFRDPRPLFEAVSWAVAAGGVELSRVRFRFLGGGSFGESPEMRAAVERAGLASRVEFLPRVSYEASLMELNRASVLLLLQASQDTVDSVPAKTFEYLRAGRPVLALVPDGATADVMRDTGGGWVVDPIDSKGLQDVIIRIYQTWTKGCLDSLRADPTTLARFSRQHLAGELAAQFDALLSARCRDRRTG
jgi:glycosyltransferase involved in cell wall biosynthesis